MRGSVAQDGLGTAPRARGRAVAVGRACKAIRRGGEVWGQLDVRDPDSGRPEGSTNLQHRGGQVRVRQGLYG